MHKIIGSLAFLLAILLVAPPFAAGQKKYGKTKEEPATKDDYKLLEKVKELDGELTYLEGSTKQMTLKVAYNYYEPNPQYRPNTRATNSYNQRVNRLMNQYNQAMNTRNPAQRMNRLQQLAVQIANLPPPPSGPSPYRLAVAYKDVNAEVPEDVVVRRLTLPLEYDDKGNVKEYTEKEKKELRGSDPKKPGYTGKWDDVQVGQKVKLYLGVKKSYAKSKKKEGATEEEKEAAKTAEKEKAADKEAAKTADKEKAAEKDAPKAADKEKAADKKKKLDDDTEEPRAHAWMILITADADPTTPDNPRKKKKQANN